MINIFISYSSKDRDAVAYFAGDLEQLGYSVWFDRELSRTGGQKWWSSILEQIRGCDIFLFALTPKSLASDPCQREYRYAHALNKRIVPIMLAAVDIPSLPMELQVLQVVDYRKRDPKQALNLASSLANLSPARPIPDPLPPEPETPLAPTVEIIKRLEAQSLSGDEQVELLSELETLLRDPSSNDTAENLLRRLYTRPDLIATVANRIERLLPRIKRIQSSELPILNRLPSRAVLAIGGIIVLLLAGIVLMFRPGVVRKIAFSSNRSGNYDIYTMDSDGSNPLQITSDTSDETEPAWSPDGKQLAFKSNRNANNDIYVINADGSNLLHLTNDPLSDTQVDWSPNGKQVAFLSNRDGNFELYTMNTDGSNLVRQTNNTAEESYARWSPDGKQLAFVSNRDGNYEIYVINTDDSNSVRLTNDAAVDTSPAWSPSGKQIAFTVVQNNAPPEIYLMNADGSNRIPLTQNTDYDAAPTWSPDGKQIAFTSDRDGNFEIYLMNPDGSNPQRLTNNPSADGNASWQR